MTQFFFSSKTMLSQEKVLHVSWRNEGNFRTL